MKFQQIPLRICGFSTKVRIVLSASQGIWAHYVDIKGAHYLTRLSNEKVGRLDVQIFDPRRSVNTVYVLEDRLQSYNTNGPGEG